MFNRSRIAALTAGLTVLTGAALVAPPNAAMAAKKTVKKAKKAKKVVVRPMAVVAPTDFGITFVADAQTVTAGGMATYAFSLQPKGNFTGPVVFELPNITDYLSARVTNTGANQLTLSINVPPFVSPVSGVFMLRGRSGNLARTALFRLNVNGAPITTTPATTVVASPTPTTPPEFTMRADVQNRSAFPGSPAQYGITVDRRGVFTGPVTLRVENAPAGTAVDVTPNPASGNAVLTLTPSASTPSGTYIMSVIGSAGSTTRATAVLLVVRRTGDFGLALAPAAVTTGAGNDAIAAVNITAVPAGAQTPDVEFTVAGLPAGVTALFTPNPTNGLAQIRFATTAAAPAGTYNVTITGNSSTVSHNLALQLTVRKNVSGFGLQAQPVTQNVVPGAIATYNVTMTPTGGFTGQVAMAVRNLPPNVSATVQQTGASTIAVRIATLETTPTGKYALELVGTSADLQATVKVELVIAS